MTTLIFIAGCAAGMAFLFIVGAIMLALGRRMTKEQREANERVNALLCEANHHRASTAASLMRIAARTGIIASKLEDRE